MGFKSICAFAFKNYWRAVFSIIWPVILLPVIILDPSPHNRCFYVVLLMAGYWITEAIHIVITSLIPLVLFPLLNLASTDEVCKSYMRDTNMMFIAGLILANAVEYSHLHIRFALCVINCVGTSPKKLHVAIVAFTAFVSMWIPNTAAVAIMLPIVSSILTELEAQKVIKAYELSDNLDEDDRRIPTKITICYYLSIAYAANIGGFATLIGTGTNLAYKGLVETIFSEGPGVNFAYFMVISTPIAVVILVLTGLLLQIWFLDLCKKTEDKEAAKLAEAAVRNVIIEKRAQMGRVTFHEIAVLLCFMFAISLWLTKDPEIFPGWQDLIEPGLVKDGTVGILVVFMLFCIPANPNFLFIFSSNEEKKPKGPSTGLITWRYVQRKLPWGLLFLLGSGFAIADTAKTSGLNDHLATSIISLGEFHPYVLMLIGCLIAGLVTQITANVVVCNVTVPIMAQMAKHLKIHPILVMYPTAISCSFSYMLPVATPPCAMVAAACNMKTWSLLSVGFVVLIISWAVLIATAPFLGTALWHFEEFPDWADLPDNQTFRR